MRITCCFPQGSEDVSSWVEDLRAALPQATVESWTFGAAPSDYAVVWRPTQDFFESQPRLKAVFNAGAGVDALLSLQLPPGVPLVRLEDAGMAEQMTDYVTHAVLHHFREFDKYDNQARVAEWRERSPRSKADFAVGVLGFGVLGRAVSQALGALGFEVAAWARSAKDEGAVHVYAGREQLDAFLARTRILICLLPLTPDTRGILNASNFRKLRHGSYVVNVGRGGHLLEQDLLDAVSFGQIAGATLDVFSEEPLPTNSALWTCPHIRITPHISAATLRSESVAQIVAKLLDIEQGRSVSGVVDSRRGY